MSYIYQKPLDGKKAGVVFGSFAPLHQGHIDIILKAKKENDAGCIVIVCGYNGDKGEPRIPHNKRYRYVREYFKDDDMVAVYAINDTKIGAAEYPHGWEVWLEEFNRIWQVAVKSTDMKRKWYVGEPDYKSGLEERNEEAELIDRKLNPISATMIRNNPIKYWDKMAHTFRRAFSHNILITGTASEGKTTLARDLGKYFNTTYSHEMPRDYMEEICVHDTELDAVDFVSFLVGQYNLNRKMINSPMNKGVFFADTDSLVTQMYAEYYSKDDTCKMNGEDYYTVFELAQALVSKSKWDKVFVLVPHGEFVDDNSRYMEHSGMKEREELFAILKELLEVHNLWDKATILDGNYYENFLTIKKYVEGVMSYE